MPLGADWLEQEAIRYVAQWETSRQGLSDTLTRRLRTRCERTGEDPQTIVDTISDVVELVVERGYVDDRRFTRQRIERGRRQGRSTAQIRAQLQAKGVEAALFAEVEAELEAERNEKAASGSDLSPDAAFDPDLEAAWRTARKHRLGAYCSDPAKRAARRQQHLATLARRGFSEDIAYRVVDADSTPDVDSFAADR